MQHTHSKLPMKNSTYLLTLLSFSLSLLSGSYSSPQRFNVDSFGAKGDSNTDSTKAFKAAWTALCGAAGPAEMYVPKGKYLLQPIKFEGKCKCPQPTVRIDGWIVGPTDYMVIANAGRWIEFDQVDNLVIQGGTLYGRGGYLKACSSTYEHDPKCPFGGRMLSISQSNNVWINNLISLYSQGFHMMVENSVNVNIDRVTIIAPWSSPNTDGIHIGNSKGVTITNTTIRTGDDCISLSQGSQNIWIEKVFCGPGHGISIGSLGSGTGESAVRNVTAKDVKFYRTQNGFRIKTWAKPYDVIVNDIHFLNAVMKDVNNPIIIDQYYCPGGGCSTSQPSYAKISDVEFKNINGTSASEVAIKFDCSPKFPCNGLLLQDVNLNHMPTPAQSQVHNADVKTIGVVRPGIRNT